jgi:hypothetical protein
MTISDAEITALQAAGYADAAALLRDLRDTPAAPDEAPDTPTVSDPLPPLDQPSLFGDDAVERDDDRADERADDRRGINFATWPSFDRGRTR